MFSVTIISFVHYCFIYSMLIYLVSVTLIGHYNSVLTLSLHSVIITYFITHHSLVDH